MSSESPTLLGRRVFLSNYAHDKPVGHLIFGPFKLSIRPTSLREIWDVEHVEGHRYLLTINDFVTKAEGDSLWSYDHKVHPDVKGTKWIIERKEGGHYTITDHEGKGWTLKEGDNIVTLEPVPHIGVPATQLWHFKLVED